MTSDQDALKSLDETYPCRQLQIQQLAQLFSPSGPSLPNLILHGLENTCKSTLLRHILPLTGIAHAIIQCSECITVRHLLERIVAASIEGIEKHTSHANGHAEDEFDNSQFTSARCENLAALAVQLGKILEVSHNKFVLVLDEIDRLREATPTLVPGLARLSETIPNLTIVFVVSFPGHRFLQIEGTPHIHFPPYTREESIRIIAQNPPSIFSSWSESDANYSETEHREDREWLWPRFCAAVWDSLAKNTSRDVVAFRGLAEKLWAPFVTPIVEGTHGTRDFSRLLVKCRGLLQGEEPLIDRIIEGRDKAEALEGGKTGQADQQNQHLTYYAKYLLCAAYLASYNHPRTDATFFMRASEKKRKKKGGGTAAPRRGRPAKHRKISRRHLPPSPFRLDRLFAIFAAILPERCPRTADVPACIATLVSLGMLQRCGVNSRSGSSSLLDSTTQQCRINVDREQIVRWGRTVNFEVEELIAEA